MVGGSRGAAEDGRLVRLVVGGGGADEDRAGVGRRGPVVVGVGVWGEETHCWSLGRECAWGRGILVVLVRACCNEAGFDFFLILQLIDFVADKEIMQYRELTWDRELDRCELQAKSDPSARGNKRSNSTAP